MFGFVFLLYFPRVGEQHALRNLFPTQYLTAGRKQTVSTSVVICHTTLNKARVPIDPIVTKGKKAFQISDHEVLMSKLFSVDLMIRLSSRF